MIIVIVHTKNEYYSLKITIAYRRFSFYEGRDKI